MSTLHDETAVADLVEAARARRDLDRATQARTGWHNDPETLRVFLEQAREINARIDDALERLRLAE